MKTDLTIGEALKLAHKICRDEDKAQEAIGFAWDRLSRGKCDTAEYPVRAALFGGIREAMRGRTLIGRRCKHERWESTPRYRLDSILPLSSDDYASRANLVCAQEYRMELGTDDASVIDALYAA